MVINFNDSKFDSISKIKQAQESGKEIFDFEEQSIFVDVRVDTVDKARKVAELLVKIKAALKKNSKDEVLTEELEEEAAKNKNQGSLAWQVINSNGYLAQKALNRLHRLLAPEKDEVPATKEDRETKRNEIKVEQNKKKAKLARNKDRQITYRSQLNKFQIEKRVAQKNYARRNNLITILRGNGEGEIIKSDGSKVKLSDFSTTITKTIKDYKGGNVSKKDSDITGTTNEKTDTLVNLIDYANDFLRNIPNIKATHETSTIPTHIQSTSLTTEFNNRQWTNKQTLASYPVAGIGHGFLTVLHDIGKDDLIKAIEANGSLSANDKEKCKKYATEITAYVNRLHRISGKLQFTNKEWETSYNSWHQTLLKVNFDDYPHVDMPDWPKIFEFMKLVFPPIVSNGQVVGLENRDYLDNKSHASYLKPKSGKLGWEGLTMTGYAGDIPSGERSIAQYIQKGVNVQPKFIGQITPNKIPDDYDFRSLTGLWWKTFYHHMDKKISDSDWLTNHNWKSNDVTHFEKVRNINLDQLRYARSMRNILKEFNISSEIDEFDEFLLQIADEADKKAMIDPREKIIERTAGIDKRMVGNQEVSFLKGVKDKEIFAGDYDWENFADKLVSMADNAYNEVLRVDSEIEQVSKQISGLASDNADLQLEIDSFEEDINFLLSLDKDQGQPLDANKTTFQTVYDEKSKQGEKWTRRQIRRMRSLLELIKNKMNDDVAFETEYKTKQEEIENIYTESGKHDKALEFSWYSIKREADDSITDAIKKIIKEKDTIATSLEDIEKEFAGLDNLIKIDDKEKNNWDEIKKAINDPTKFQDAPVSTLNEAVLTTLFGFDVNKELKDKWAITLDTVVLTEANIKTFFLNDYGKTKSKHGALLDHLSKSGDVDGNKYTIDDDTKKEAAWKEFIEKGPEKVIKTIIDHEFEEIKDNDAEKGKITKKMEEAKDGEKELNKSKYGGENFDDPGIKKFMYEEKIGKPHEFLAKDEQNDNGDDTPKTENKSWFKFGDSNWRPFVTYGVGALVIIAAVSAIFWKNIADWWNGPAEEEGQGTTKEDEKEDENE